MCQSSSSLALAIKDFLASCCSHTHVVHFQDWVSRLSNNRLTEFQKGNEELGFKPGDPGVGTATCIIDLVKPSTNYLRCSIGSHWTSGNQAKSEVEEWNLRTNGLVIASIHEAWERFIKKVFAVVLFKLKRAGHNLSKKELGKFHQTIKNPQNHLGTPLYFDELAQYLCRTNCAAAISFFNDKLNMQPTSHQRYLPLHIKWSDCHKLIEVCRHCCVHADGKVSQRTAKRLNGDVKRVVESITRQSSIYGDSRILIPAMVVDQMIEAIASYAYFIYEQAGKSCNLAQEYNLFAR